MLASNVEVGQWFQRVGEGRIWRRAKGRKKRISGVLGVPVISITMPINDTGYIPADEPVVLVRATSVRIA